MLDPYHSVDFLISLNFNSVFSQLLPVVIELFMVINRVYSSIFPVEFSLFTFFNRLFRLKSSVGIDRINILDRKNPLRAPVETNISHQNNSVL